MFEKKDYNEENVVETIYFQGLHGRLIKCGEEEIDVSWNQKEQWYQYNSPLAILEQLELGEEYLDNLSIGAVVVFHDMSVF